LAKPAIDKRRFDGSNAKTDDYIPFFFWARWRRV